MTALRSNAFQPGDEEDRLRRAVARGAGRQDIEALLEAIKAKESADSLPRVESTPSQAYEIDDKRFYVPGSSIFDRCPKCNEVVERDLGKNYLGYPKVGKPFDYVFYCTNEVDGDTCEAEWIVKIVLEIKVRLAQPG